MDSEKKPKRPRIGTLSQSANHENGETDGRYEKVNYPNDENQGDRGYQRNYVPGYQRNYGYQQQHNGYQNRNRYNNQYDRPGYQQGYPANHPDNDGMDSVAKDSTVSEEGQNPQEGYQQRQAYQPRQGYQQQYQGGYHNRQNNYNRQQRPGGYQQRQGGYQNYQGYQQRQGGYDNQGGYQQRPGGYQRQGGYQNNNRQGGYQNNRQGGYQNNRQGGYQNRQGGYQNGYRKNNGYNKNQGNMKFTPRPKQIDYIIDDIDPNEEIRLNKYMSNAGICSRREADEFITQGLVRVNGEVVTELGTKIKRDDVVEYDEKVVVPERKCYVLLNKPKDCVTTSDDPNGRTTVLDIVKNACKERIYPVGRLDRNTTGVLLLTNDGDLASKLTHPKYVKKKIYHVWTDKDISEEDMQRIADGIELPDGEIHADAISYVSETDRNQAGIEIHSGRNRIVRRIFESLGYRVTKLDRVYFAGLTKKNLPRGKWRYLTQDEVNFLRMGSFE